MKRWPLGWKLMGWSVLIVGTALGLSLLCIRGYVRSQENAELDGLLASEATHFLEQFHGAGSRLAWVRPHEVEEILLAAHASDRFLLITDTGGRVLYRSGNQPSEDFLKHPPGHYAAFVGQKPVRLAVVSDGKLLTIYLADGTAEIDELIDEITRGYLVALPIILLVVCGGSWWLARQALLPVKRIADAANAIRSENLGTRLPGEDVRDEIGRLATVVNEMLARLEDGFQQATRFSADASHELRTPLTVLRSGLDVLLRDTDLSELHRETVADLQLQTSRLISLVNSLLLLARADAGHLRLELATADLADVIADCVEDARIVAGERGVTIECAPLPTAPVQVDTTRIRQILSNVLDNAVKYNVPGGRVAVELELTDGWYSLRIGNDGPGISVSARPNVFKRFYRAEQQEDQPGTGLGLSLARELASSHGGDLRLSATLPNWTEFELRLPIHTETARVF